jgi:predicted RNA-binding protein YlqC (UPF0109 family)
MIEQDELLATSRQLLSRIICALIDDPTKVEIDARAMPHRINWNIRVGVNDAGKLIGKGAAHIKALTVVMTLIGRRHDSIWKLMALDPHDGPRAEAERVEPVKGYNPEPAWDLLTDIAEAICEDWPQIGVEKGTSADGSEEFTFTLKPALAQDWLLLGEPIKVNNDRRDGRGMLVLAEKIDLASALQTIFRAYGRQQGVSFKVAVATK